MSGMVEVPVLSSLKAIKQPLNHAPARKVIGGEGLPKNRTILNESLRRELGNKEAFHHETKTLLSRANHSCGKAATRELNRLLGRSVYVEDRDTDRYGSTVAVLWTRDGVNVNLEMVCRGAAWWYERYSRGETDLRECQESARESNLGLWDGDPVEPWEWRRR